MTDLATWRERALNTSNINRFLVEHNYVKYKTKIQEGSLIMRYRDNKTPWCADIEIDIRMNGQQNPPIMVLSKIPIYNGNGVKDVIEELYTWSELYRFILQLRNDTSMGSAISTSKHEHLAILPSMHSRATPPSSPLSRLQLSSHTFDILQELHSRIEALKAYWAES